MKIARFDWRGGTRVGVVHGQELVVMPVGTDVLGLLQSDASQRAELEDKAAAATIPVSDVRLLAPLVPASVRDFVCFERHLEGMALSTGDTVPESRLYEPTFYFSNPHGVHGAHDDIEVPPDCVEFDYELEVAAVIGRPGRNLSPEQAREHVVGFTIFNDWTARDIAHRARRNGLHANKAKDSAITLGPCIVTADELESYWRDDMLDLGLTVWRNDVQMGTDRLANMSWSFGEIVSYSARGAWIGPGDVIASGTCGSGCLAELWGRAGRLEPPPLVDGDVVRMTVEAIGTIESRVVAASENPVPVLPARRVRG